MVTYQSQEDGLKHLPWFPMRFRELQHATDGDGGTQKSSSHP